MGLRKGDGVQGWWQWVDGSNDMRKEKEEGVVRVPIAVLRSERGRLWW